MNLINTAILFTVAAIITAVYYGIKKNDFEKEFFFSGGVIVGVWGLLIFNWISS